MSRWLALYIDEVSNQRAAIITPKAAGDLPFGVNEYELGLEAFDGEPVVFVELPDDSDFRPMIVDNVDDREIAVQFIDL